MSVTNARYIIVVYAVATPNHEMRKCVSLGVFLVRKSSNLLGASGGRTLLARFDTGSLTVLFRVATIH